MFIRRPTLNRYDVANVSNDNYYYGNNRRYQDETDLIQSNIPISVPDIHCKQFPERNNDWHENYQNQPTIIKIYDDSDFDNGLDINGRSYDTEGTRASDSQLARLDAMRLAISVYRSASRASSFMASKLSPDSNNSSKYKGNDIWKVGTLSPAASPNGIRGMNYALLEEFNKRQMQKNLNNSQKDGWFFYKTDDPLNEDRTTDCTMLVAGVSSEEFNDYNTTLTSSLTNEYDLFNSTADVNQNDCIDRNLLDNKLNLHIKIQQKKINELKIKEKELKDKLNKYRLKEIYLKETRKAVMLNDIIENDIAKVSNNTKSLISEDSFNRRKYFSDKSKNIKYGDMTRDRYNKLLCENYNHNNLSNENSGFSECTERMLMSCKGRENNHMTSRFKNSCLSDSSNRTVMPIDSFNKIDYVTAAR